MKEKVAITNQSVSLRRTLTREQCGQVFNELMQTEGIRRSYNRGGFPTINDTTEREAIFIDDETGGVIILRVSEEFTGVNYTIIPKKLIGMDESHFVYGDEAPDYEIEIMEKFQACIKRRFTAIPDEGWKIESVKHTIPIDMAVLGNVPASHYLRLIAKGDLIPSDDSDYYKIKRSASATDEDIMIVYTYDDHQMIFQYRTFLDRVLDEEGELKTRELLLFEVMAEFHKGHNIQVCLTDEFGEDAIADRYRSIVSHHPFRKMKDNLAIIQEHREMINMEHGRPIQLGRRLQPIGISDLVMAEDWLNTFQQYDSIYTALKSFEMTSDKASVVNYVTALLDDLEINPIILPDNYQRDFLLNPIEEWIRYCREENN